MLTLLVACGGEEAAPAQPAATTPPPTASPAPRAPAAVPATRAPATQAPQQPAAAQKSPLEEYAAKSAGGPGAIYVGDITQMAGPAPGPDQGDFDGNVTLESLEASPVGL